MRAVRAEYYSSLRAMARLTSETLLTDTLPISAPSNRSARILRHGLAVAAFSSLEHYIERRFEYFFDNLSSGQLPYSEFSDELRRFLTIEAVNGLSNRTRFRAHTDRLTYSETGLNHIGAYLGGSGPYKAYGFSPKGSNVARKDIETAFKAVGVQRCWQRMGAIATAIGSSRISLADDFDQLGRTRNRSAHNPSGNVPTANLLSHIQNAILIGIAADILLSNAAGAFSRAQTQTQLTTAMQSITTSVRFLDEEPTGSWIERAFSGHPMKRYASEAAAAAGVSARGTSNLTVVRDQQSIAIGLI